MIKDIVVKAKGGSEINFCDERICVRNIENENSIVYLYDIKDRKAKKVALEDDYNITYIEEIVTDGKGTDYVVMNVDATNGKNYEEVIDVSKGKTKKIRYTIHME